MNTEISFQKSGPRDTARYVSATTVCEEALQDSRWIGLYWSASGQVQRENVVTGLPGLKPLEFPLHAFAPSKIRADQERHGQWQGLEGFQQRYRSDCPQGP